MTPACPSHLEKKKPRFYEKKRIKEKKEKKKEKPFALTEGYFFYGIAFENLKRNSFLYVAPGAVPGEYITYPLLPGK